MDRAEVVVSEITKQGLDAVPEQSRAGMHGDRPQRDVVQRKR